LIATPVIPQNIGLRLDAARRHHRRTGRCLVCSLLDEEREAGTRLIGERSGFIALCPFASRFPYEILIAPTGHAANFFEIDEEGLRGLAECLKDMLGRLRSAAGNPPFNLFLNTAPFPRGRSAPRNRRSWGRQFHWTLEILPRQTAVAGFEWASGFHINSASPERCAERMRRSRDS
jgi:UDPglucose--hexose-1-phosphate uridylyltransferase